MSKERSFQHDELERVKLERDAMQARLAEYDSAISARSTRWIYRALRHVRTVLVRLESRTRRIRTLSSLKRPGAADDSEGELAAFRTPSTSPDGTEDPIVSFIVPVYGNLDLTRRCLASLDAGAGTVPYEVIVIDDGSPGDDWAFISQIEGIVALRNEENLGYLRSVNRAASQARGRFLFLLNNDTVVAEGCVESLVRTAERSSTIGAVGAKLLFPDGRLQEAGSFVWRDGSGHNFGHGKTDGHSDYNFVREVDYCSAAALLVRASTWEAIGGFDDRYAPAYYEDTDLAFSIRQIGLRVVYQPLARVFHIAGASHGSAAATHQERNRQVFVDKWSEALADHDPPRPVLCALPRVNQQSVLFVDEHVPRPNRDSGSLRMSRLLQAVASAERRITFASISRHPIEPATTVLRQAGIDVEDGARSLRSVFRARAADLDAIVVSRPQVAATAIPLARRCAPGVPIVYDMVDFHLLRHERGSRVTQHRPSRYERRMSAMEATALQDADHVIAVTRDEAEAIRSARPSLDITVIGNIHEIERSETSFEQRDGVLFIGSWNHRPNRDAIEWLLREVMPAVWHRDPSMHLHLVGSDLPVDLGSCDGRVVNHGWCAELSPRFDQVRISIAPLRFGAGIKGKVGDSLARGVPVVGTSIAAEGFDASIAGLGDVESVDEIAEAAVALHGDKQRWLAAREAGLRTIERHATAHAAATAFDELMSKIGNR